MKIEEALFMYDGSQEKMKVEDIKNHKDFLLIKSHLFCATPNCECPLIYANGQKPYLRTFPKQDHSDSCQYSLQRIEAEKRSKTKETIKRGFSSDEIHTKHKYAFNKYFAPPEKKKVHKQKQHNTSKKVNSNNNKESTVAITPTLDKANTLKNSKTGSIQTNHLSINEMDDKNIGKVVNVVGTVSYINYDTEKSLFILKLEDHDNYEITFPESYLASSPNKYNLKQAFIGISRLITNSTVVCCITTDLQKVNDKYQLPIYNITNLSFGISDNPNKAPTPLTPLNLMEKISKNRFG